MTSSVEVQSPEKDYTALPTELRAVEAAIQESRTILDLKDDWDGEGSCGYAASTLERVNGLLSNNALSLWRSQRVQIPAPVIGPGPDGSIDINWQLTTRKLLVNVPADADKLATFYGSDRVGRGELAHNVIEGRLDTSVQNQWLLMWIAM